MNDWHVSDEIKCILESANADSGPLVYCSWALMF